MVMGFFFGIQYILCDMLLFIVFFLGGGGSHIKNSLFNNFITAACLWRNEEMHCG